MLKYKNTKTIEVSDWDNLVEESYGREYSFQQQDGCQSRGTVKITVPSEHEDDFENDSVPEEVNGSEMGVSFKAWLTRDPKQKIPGQTDDYELRLFWNRNFYPSLQAVANDLHKKGLIEAGEYSIIIDW